MNTIEDRKAVRMLVRAREDYQGVRKRLDNRMGRKADGTEQDVGERTFRAEDFEAFKALADNAREQEKAVEKMLLNVLKRFSVYTNYLAHVKGVGPIAAGWIVGEYDIEKATTVSKLWQFTGLNPGLVWGQKRVDDGEDKFHYVLTDKLVRGDKLTEGFVAPFNQRLRTALVGVMADGFIKAQNSYALDYYYPYKSRLEQEANPIAGEEKAWSEVSKGHRDRAAKRYMVKMFLKDLYVAWRTIEGLPMRAPYAEEYLGKQHEPVLAGR
ncbi:MAG: hypothetical protein Q7K03_10590 [Dehalococcoidia bacterium]|nr:hypothetical protein [Dehalococcoidia bacterium]